MSTIYTPNTGLIQGVQHFYTATKPTTRPNGSALVIGDRWWKTDEGTEWFWNGTYWLGERQSQSLILYSNLTQTSQGMLLGHRTPAVGIIIEYYVASFFIESGNLSDTNYHVLRFHNQFVILYDLVIKSGDNGAITSTIKKSTPYLGIVILNAADNGLYLAYRYDAGNGNPPSSNNPPKATLIYREVL